MELASSSWFTLAAEATSHNVSYAIAGICLLFVSLSRFLKARKLPVGVPLEGGTSGVISSYRGAHEFVKSARHILRDAYKKYGHRTFQIPEMNWYTVVINRRDLIEEVRKAPDDKVSFDEAMAEVFRWVFGQPIGKPHYHIHVIQNQLTRSLGILFGDVLDEISQAFKDLIPANGGDWAAVHTMDFVRNVVCRTSNRIFVGLPLCRNADYIDLNVNFTIDVSQAMDKVNSVPGFLRPIVGRLISPTSSGIRRGMRHLRPLMEERFRMYDENGDDWSGKPVDMISWLIDELPEDEKRNMHELTRMLLSVNFAAIHTSSNSFTHAIYHLAAEPKYITPLREEIQRVVSEEGWTKIAITKMWKLDSFMKESQRLNGVQLLTLSRKVMTDFTLSDGTFLPAGTLIAANVEGAHHDEALYPNADKFDGFRFSNLREESAEECVKHQMVNTSAQYLAFGHGRHACPGRFFAVNELKAMMAYLILNYDVKAEVDGVRPENIYFGTRLSPSPTAKVLIRKRSDT